QPSLSLADVTVNEGVGTATVQVSLSSATDVEVTGDYGSADASASAGSDYTGVAGSLSIAPGETSASIDIVIIDDGDEEPTETLTVTLENIVGALAGNTAATVTILDNDSATAQTLFSDVSVSSGLSGYLGESYGLSWGDLNGDNRPDLYINRHRQMPALFVNQGGGAFTDVGDSIASWTDVPRADTHGGSWADFDNDGDQDLYASIEITTLNRFMVNDGGQLTDQAAIYDPAVEQWRPRLPIWFDYSGDGLLDFVMASGPRASVSTASPMATFKQSGTGFVDESQVTGLDCENAQVAYLADVTRDGQLDFICGKAQFPHKIYDYTSTPFSNVTGQLPSASAAIDTAIADFNGDLVSDFFVVRGALRPSEAAAVNNRRVDAQLITNGRLEKSFSFVTGGDVTFDVDWSSFQLSKIFIGAQGLSPSSHPFTLSPSDATVEGLDAHDPATDEGLYIGYDPADSRWTLAVSPGSKWQYAAVTARSTSAVSGISTSGIETQDGPMRPTLMLSNATGYRSIDNATGPIQCASAAAADFDNDMDVDLYLVCRGGVQNIPNRLLLNDGNGNFTEVEAAGGAAGAVGPALTGAGTGDSVALADFDVDGYIDIAITNGLNMQPRAEGGPDQLFRNQMSGNHWIQLDLEGTISNRDGIGATVIATAGGVAQYRAQDGGYHRWSQNHSRIHFGLAANTTVDLEITWPSGQVDVHEGVAADALYTVTEGGAIQIVELQ
ncbi:MAG: FG-GAP-like repeat-containing protein, partial [Thiohalocapsa sp.]|nr:FG-GAP-like repeat-containing protein [Thiohalocapsa sp.]